MTVYYNEFDPQVAAWLRVLIAEGHIAPGVVDERSIEDVRPSDLRGFKQCHFFAGIGVWSYALRRAGWRDDRPIWTGSCPCQPFSAAGKGAGFDDERHLWPAFQWLIQECKPECVVGEQVASAAVDDWIDLVHADLEALGYAFGSVPFPSAGVGAPHIRDRNYWMAHAGGQGLAQRKRNGRVQREALGASAWQTADGGGAVGGMADANGGQQHGIAVIRGAERDWQYARWAQGSSQPEPCGDYGRLADTDSNGCSQRSVATAPAGHGDPAGAEGRDDRHEAAGPTNGYWRDADWLGCTDGKWRPVEPGTFPLAHGAAARVVRLRGYGNAINAEAAKAWIETVMECLP